MKLLCDSNVFLALAVETHVHHSAALRWLEAQPKGTSISFCRATQTSFLRLLTSAECLGEGVCTNEEAITVYRTLRSDSRVDLLATEPLALEKFWLEYASSAKPSPKLWMDSYLAAFARAMNIPFVTFDRGFAKFPGLELIVLNS